jgi:hypothetical protein
MEKAGKTPMAADEGYCVKCKEKRDYQGKVDVTKIEYKPLARSA